MASKAEVVQDSHGEIVVRVTHLDTDSFTRSVDPAANKAWKRAHNVRSVTHVKGNYAFMEGATPRECVSVVAYSTSFERAQALCDEYVTVATCESEHTDCEHCGVLGCADGACALPAQEVIQTYPATLETPAEYEGVCSECCPGEFNPY